MPRAGSLPYNPRIPTGPPLSFSKGNISEIGKNGFPMQTAKNRFHILVVHLKKHVIKITHSFLCTFTGPIPKAHFRRTHRRYTEHSVNIYDIILIFNLTSFQKQLQPLTYLKRAEYFFYIMFVQSVTLGILLAIFQSFLYQPTFIGWSCARDSFQHLPASQSSSCSEMT